MRAWLSKWFRNEHHIPCSMCGDGVGGVSPEEGVALCWACYRKSAEFYWEQGWFAHHRVIHPAHHEDCGHCRQAVQYAVEVAVLLERSTLEEDTHLKEQ